MGPTVQSIIILIILILLSAFFSSAETALMKVNKIKMRNLADNKNRKANLVLKLTEDSSKLLSTILIGNNVVNLSASSFTTILVEEKFHSIPISVATFILTFLILVFGEIVPKTAATLYADNLSLLYIYIIYFLMIILTPIIWFLNVFSRIIMKLFGIDPDKKNAAITEDEFLTVADVASEEGVIEEEERDMIENVVDFGDSYAKDIMVPRIDIEAIEDTTTYAEIEKIFRDSYFSRLPVYHESTDNIIGIVFLKDFFSYSGRKENFKIQRVMRKPYFTFEMKKTSDLLTELREKKLSIAIVLDEYGATAGLITVEDLLEEIVGELRDEYDFDEVDLITQKDDNTYIIDGSAKLDEIEETVGIQIETDEYDSIAGHIMHLLEHIPDSGEITEDEFARYKVLKVDKNRIETIELTKKEIISEDD